MPETPELDTDHLQETAREPPGESLLRNIALTTAVFAAFGAVAALQAGSTVNHALVLKTEAGRLQAEASDQWAYYQAKGIKAAVQEGAQASYLAAGKTPPEKLQQTIQRYGDEQRAIEAVAHGKEHERDAKSQEADELLERHHMFATIVALLQVSIALGAVAALTRIRLIWAASGLMGLAGVGMFLWSWLR